jgi:hypothetical protein
MSIRPRWKHSALAATLVGLAATISACGTDDTPEPAEPGPVERDATPGPVPPDTPPAGEETELRLLTPLDGDVVDVPFVLYVDTDVELGASEDGLHQLHVWFDDDDADPLILTSANASIDEDGIDIPEGDTRLNVRLYTAEREPVGDAASVEITIYDGQAGGESA